MIRRRRTIIEIRHSFFRTHWRLLPSKIFFWIEKFFWVMMRWDDEMRWWLFKESKKQERQIFTSIVVEWGAERMVYFIKSYVLFLTAQLITWQKKILSRRKKHTVRLLRACLHTKMLQYHYLYQINEDSFRCIARARLYLWVQGVIYSTLQRWREPWRSFKISSLGFQFPRCRFPLEHC